MSSNACTLPAPPIPIDKRPLGRYKVLIRRFTGKVGWQPGVYFVRSSDGRKIFDPILTNWEFRRLFEKGDWLIDLSDPIPDTQARPDTPRGHHVFLPVISSLQSRGTLPQYWTLPLSLRPRGRNGICNV